MDDINKQNHLQIYIKHLLMFYMNQNIYNMTDLQSVRKSGL